MLAYGNYWAKPAAEIVHKLICTRETLPDAIFCANDVMAIAVCDALREEGFRVPVVDVGERFQFEISSSPLLSVIYKKCGWDVTQTYNVTGISYPEHRLVEYKLEEVRQIAPNQFVDPENLEDGRRW